MYPTSNSSLSPKINSGLSTSIIIKVNTTTVGAIQNLSIQQTRDMLVLDEIGTDGTIEIVPKGNARIDINVERIVFDDLTITEAFGRGFVNIQAQRFPFDIQLINTSNSSSEGDVVLVTMHGCWFSSVNPTYNVNSFIITERANLKCEYITTTRQGISAVNGGSRDIGFDFDTIERSTDTNGLRGRLDSSGFVEGE